MGKNTQKVSIMMSYENIRRFLCDAVKSEDCKEDFEDWNVSKSIFNKCAKRDGWVFEKGKHYCPECWKEIEIERKIAANS